MLFVAMVSAAVVLLELRTPVNVYDEGNILTGAQRILAGEIPVADFWTVYPPGQFYVVASMLALFGNDVLAPRLYDSLVRAAIVVLGFAFAKRLAGIKAAAPVAVVFCLGLAAVDGHYLYPVTPAFLLGLASIAVWHRSVSTATGPRSRRIGLAASGALAGLATWFRWDIAGYALLGLFAVNLWLALRPNEANRTIGREALRYGCFAAIATAAVGYGALILRAGPQAVWTQLVVFPITGMREARWLPHPPLWPIDPRPAGAWVGFYLTLLALVVGVSALAAAVVRTTRPATWEQVAALCCGLFGLALFMQTLVRFDRSHLLSAALMAMFTVSVGFALSEVGTASHRLLAALLGCVLVVGLYSPVRVSWPNTRDYSRFGCHSDLQRSACVAIDAGQASAVAYVEAVTALDERIFVANTRNDRFLTNDSSCYFLANRLPATRYHELHPGIADTAAVQSEIVSEMEAARVNCVVLFAAPESVEPNLSSMGRGVHILDDYLDESFVPVVSFGDYHVLARTGPVTPE